MSDTKRTKPHVRARIVGPLEKFTPIALAYMDHFVRELRGRSPRSIRAPPSDS
jgi:hypothetical protein